MKSYFACWAEVAAALFSQALAGEPEISESLAKPLEGEAFGWAAILTGDIEGRFSVLLDCLILESPLMGEGADQKAGWKELLRETFDAAAGEMLARTGKKCQVVACEEIDAEGQVSHGFLLRSGDRSWTFAVCDGLRMLETLPQHQTGRPDSQSADRDLRTEAAGATALTPGLELLLDVELEASLRFGAREMPLGEILELGPGDVVELDRNVADPVDLIVGDKIVARGEVVLVNGNFGLRVTEVSAPRKRLESVRCLF